MGQPRPRPYPPLYPIREDTDAACPPGPRGLGVLGSRVPLPGLGPRLRAARAGEGRMRTLRAAGRVREAPVHRAFATIRPARPTSVPPRALDARLGRAVAAWHQRKLGPLRGPLFHAALAVVPLAVGEWLALEANLEAPEDRNTLLRVLRSARQLGR